MSTDAKSVPRKQKRTSEEISKMPSMPLYDEQRRLWGFFFPEDAAMLKTRTAEEWFRVARRLLDDEPARKSEVSVSIPFAEDSGKINGKFFLCPWPDVPDPPPTPLTRAEVEELCRMADEPGKSLTFDEVMEELDQILAADDDENGET
jgi:hypothetical protein